MIFQGLNGHFVGKVYSMNSRNLWLMGLVLVAFCACDSESNSGPSEEGGSSVFVPDTGPTVVMADMESSQDMQMPMSDVDMEVVMTSDMTVINCPEGEIELSQSFGL